MKYLYIILIIMLGIIPYSNTLKNPFMWDDVYFIENSNFIKKWENTKVFFSPKKYFKYTQDLTYRPLPFLIHILNYKIWGINPVGHRLSNIFLHIINAVLLFIIVSFILKDYIIAFLSSLFFAIHPINNEVVNMVSFNETQLSTIFFLLAFYFYIKSRGNVSNFEKPDSLLLSVTSATNSFLPTNGSVVGVDREPSADRETLADRQDDGKERCHSEPAAKNLYFFSVIYYFIAIFSKENAVMLPVVIILYDFVFGQRLNIRKYLPFVMVTLFYLFIRFFIFRNSLEYNLKYPGDSFIINIWTILKAVPIYLKMLIFPVDLSVEYKMQIPRTFMDIQIGIGLLAVSIFVLISVYFYKASKITFFWIMWIPLTFLPVSNIMPMQNIVAERYLYLSVIGFCVISALIIKSINIKYALPVAVLIVFCYYFAIVNRNRDWHNKFIFNNKVLEQHPYSSGANMNMGMFYYNIGDFQKALKYLNYSIELNPDEMDTKNLAATVYYAIGDYKKATGLFEEVLKSKKYTYHKAPFMTIGLMYKLKGNYKKAVEYFNKVIEIDPLSASAYTNIGEIYDGIGNLDKAIKYYEKSVNINPDDFIPYNSLGILYGQKGMYDKAMKNLKRAKKIKPQSADIYFNIGYIYFLTQKYEESFNIMQNVLSIDPKYERAKELLIEIEKCKVKGKMK